MENLAYQLYGQLKDSSHIVYVAMFMCYDDDTLGLITFDTKGTKLT